MTAPLGTAALVEAEHTDFCAFVVSLTDTQWRAPSLCAGWSVRDVVVHITDHVHRTGPGAAGALVRGGLSPTRAAQRTVHRHDAMTTRELVEWFEEPVRAPSIVQLSELLIHQQDIRRPLGSRRAVAPERVAACLVFSVSRKGNVAVAGARKRAEGLHLIANEIGWTYGAGPEVRGTGEAILMALNGRGEAADELTGDGAVTLRSRCVSSNDI